jgi:hypothetical protein
MWCGWKAVRATPSKTPTVHSEPPGSAGSYLGQAYCTCQHTHTGTHTHPSSWNSTTSCSLLLGQLWGGFYGLWCVHSRVSSLPVSSFLGEMLVDYWRGESWQWITYITPSYPPLVLPQTGLFCSRTSLLQIAHFPSIPRWLYFSRRNEVVEYELRIELACF